GLSDDDLAFLEELDRAISAPPAPDRSAGKHAELKPVSAAPPAPDEPVDLAFLDELDRAIRASAAETKPDAPGASSEPAASAAEVVLCTECGAHNELGSWYCEICGAELTQPDSESVPAAAAISASASAPAPELASATAEPLLCKECGAENKPGTWYCEICGSEL
ncbi:MAG TPA: zinc finger protein, partial [Longimicrobium sp.]|nr:zinc finger protein [Longimicrobium sp.]